MRLRLYAAVAAALCACAAPSRAEKGPGSLSGEFLRIGVGPRAVGLGEAYTGLAEGALALVYNPAGLGFQRRRELSLAHDEYAPGVRHEWVAYAHPTPWGTFAASANLILVEGFEAYDAFDRPSGETSAREGAYQLGYAAPLTPSWSVGGAVKLISSRLHDAAAKTAAADAGVLWRPHESLRLGAALQNAGPGLRHVSETAALPTTLRGGFSWTPFNPRDFSHYFTLAGDVVKVREDGVSARGGVELWYDQRLALRAGGRSDASAGPGLSLGMGLRLYHDEHAPVELDFDYAFTDSGEFAETHRAGLTLRFGDAVTDNAWSEFFRRERRYEEDAPKPLPRRARQRARETPQIEPREARPSSPTRDIPTDFENWIKP